MQKKDIPYDGVIACCGALAGTVKIITVSFCQHVLNSGPTKLARVTLKWNLAYDAAFAHYPKRQLSDDSKLSC
jgi:hypothetical protein